MYCVCMYSRRVFTVFTFRRKSVHPSVHLVFTGCSLWSLKNWKNRKKVVKMENKNQKSKMYAEVTKPWNPFVGCNHNCRYCDPSFKRQAKRQKNRCDLCYNFVPHFHPERLKNLSFPKEGMVFCCGMGDIAFATKDQIIQILDVVRDHPQSTFLLQSKNPSCFYGLNIPDNAIVGTTLESNRVYPEVSNAPSPDNRAFWLRRLGCRHKSVTIEPIMDFDHEDFVNLIRGINPDWVWVGYNNYPNQVELQEPCEEKTLSFIEALKSFTDVHLKTIREKA